MATSLTYYLLTKYRLEQGACALERKANKESTRQNKIGVEFGVAKRL